jgi:hypothetical protein
MLKDKESGALSCGANIAPASSNDNVEALKIASRTSQVELPKELLD